jgi:hypothetical protein
MDDDIATSAKRDPELVKFEVYKPHFRDYCIFIVASIFGTCFIVGYFIFKALQDYSPLFKSD